ncbi:hypothetical protein Rleg5DRAFT_1464 [Rhizobium leguminosarum bv. viciae WSM1455]|nr:hypothetical protein Rleg5DRAFT_1464 [Rhizobium leguminosarum bv. viciae WSM1455]
MSTTTDFVSELVRAANEVDELTSFEVTNLLSRSIITILDLRELTGIPSSLTPQDAVVVLREITNNAGGRNRSDPGDGVGTLQLFCTFSGRQKEL